MNKNMKKVGLGCTKMIAKVSPITLSKILYKIKFGKPLDLKNPKGFNEKLQWLKFNYNNPLVAQCGDKYDMHSYVKSKGCESVLNEVYGVYRNVSEIDYNKLPGKFVLKGTHGCGFNIICTNKEMLDIEKTNKLLVKWLKTNYALVWGEVHYGKMEPKIIVEKFIEGSNEHTLEDYKIFCFDGKPYCTMICKDRKSGQGKAQYHYYDKNWKTIDWCNNDAEYTPKPKSFEAMIKYSEILSKGFPFVRMDFYDTKSGPILGEMTFTPCAALDTDYSVEGERILGDMIRISNL
ncbi:ATP-grasp fold amidoligase family protein [uncultured Clostridium sp.]|jgi:hypothetical protein|uniref:ATP-grasp fold amidoligase family protein n=1 Tax=uncultured Clostridium sp. TaxID=59620 RepID=UPI00260DA210|nr:ATP-grasp fold amidoligase family protein [uncultured Clostridium sp.]